MYKSFEIRRALTSLAAGSQITLQTAVVHTNQVMSSLNVTQRWTLKAGGMTGRNAHFIMESVMQITSAR